MQQIPHMNRLVIFAFAIWAILFPVNAAVKINEIHYHQDLKTEPVEFLELYNSGAEAVDLSGWAFSRGVRFTFPPGTRLEPDGYLVVAEDPVALREKFGADSLGPWEGRLSNQGERVVLVDAQGGVVDEVRYEAGFPWPTVGDAPGYSIELVNPAFDNSLGGNWRRSLHEDRAGPTPGARNSVFAENIGPQIRAVEHSPREPRSAEPVRISAKITDPDGVASVHLHYQVVDPGNYIELTDPAFETDWTTVPMNDQGEGGDGAAGDSVFTVELPGSIQQHRRLVRYRITAADGAGYSVSVPYPDDPQPNFAYFVYDGVPAWRGAVRPGVTPEFEVAPEEMSRLPVYHLISKRSSVENSTWFERYRGSDYKWRGTLVYDGRVYDHIRYRARGGVWRYAMVKNMWKFRFNRGHELQARDNWGNKYKTTWRRLNLGASIQQGNFNHRGEQGMFESLGFRLFNLAGVEGPHTTFATFRVISGPEEAGPATQYEGDFWGVYLAVEQPDRRFLDEHGLPNGNFYKMEGGTGELNNLGRTGPDDKSDLNEFLGGYNNAPDSWWRENFDLEKYYSYQAIVQGIHHYDICHDKNFFYFHDPDTGLWSVHPWDLDLTWAENMYDAGCGGVDRIKARLLNGARPAVELEYRNRVREIRDLLFNEDQAWALIDEYARLLQGEKNGPTLLDADRAMWDYNPKMNSGTYSTNPSSKAGTGRFYQWPSPYSRDFDGLVQLMKDYVVFRSVNTTGRDPSLDRIANDPVIPETPVITYDGPPGFPANRLRFQSSPYSGVNPFAAVKWRIGEVTRVDSPDYDPSQPHRYEIDAIWESSESRDLEVQVPSNAARPGAVYRARVRMKDATGRWSHWSAPIEFVAGEQDNAGALVEHLKVTELMYHAPGGSDFDYIELFNNSSSRTLDLGGVAFTDGVEFTFPDGTLLPPESRLLMVKDSPEENFSLFRAHYGLGTDVAIAGPYSGNFRRSGERVEIQTAAGETILAFSYSPGRGWPIAAAGAGHSLVPLESTFNRQARALDYGGNWRASGRIGGSPGQADSPAPPGIVINEFMVHTPPANAVEGAQGSGAWIELYNPTGQAIDLADHYLSDRADHPRLWSIPPGNLPPGGRITFDEGDFNHPPGAGVVLSRSGGELFLSHLPGTIEDRVVDGVRFMAREPDVSLGRYPDGGPHWHNMEPTPDAPNGSPRVSVVISELMYNPPRAEGQEDNTLDEFVELFNPGDEAVLLDGPEGGWRIADGIRFAFPSNTIIPAGGYLLLVSFDPSDASLLDDFRATYRVRADLPILGPYDGRLSNSGERIALEKPLAPEIGGEEPLWVLVDEVIYFDRSPWPRAPDGNGPSLQRLFTDRSGNDPDNWIAGEPSAGGSLLGEGNLPLAPGSLTAVPGSGQVILSWAFSAAARSYNVYRASVEAGPYVMIANGITSATHTDPDVPAGATYFYAVTAVNSAGESEPSAGIQGYSTLGSGSILREWWLGISGNAVSQLTSHPNYPDNPSGSEQISRFEGPTNWADNYGTRVRGYVHPPVDGAYTFWIAGDDNCELWLSPDANPSGATLIARVPGWTNPREWTRFAEQRSESVELMAGQKYYIEALHKEGGGGDNLAVAWQGPGFTQQVIDGAHLSPWTGQAAAVPSGLSALGADGRVVLGWNALPGATSYRVKRSLSSGGPYATIVSGLVSPAFTDREVVNGTTYYYVVTAMVAGEETPNSSQAGATPWERGGADYANAVLAAGPVAYWRFNEPLGSVTAQDHAGEHHASYGQAVTLGAQGPRPPLFDAFEADNTAIRFSTGLANSYVTAPPLGIETDTLTITAWINPSEAVSFGGILFYRSGGGSASGLNLRSAGTLGYHWNDVSSTWGWESGLRPPLNQWSFVALVIEPWQATIHLINEAGAQSASRAASHAPRLFSGDLRIGADSFGDSRIFEGRIDEAAIFDQALSPEQIERLYRGEMDGAPLELRAAWNSQGTITLSWDRPARLQSTSRFAGPETIWVDEESDEGALTIIPSETKRFFRLAQ